MFVGLQCDGQEDVALLLQALPRAHNWKAWLMIGPQGRRTVVARLEAHLMAKEGVHVHADCSEDIIVGPESIEGAKHRLPDRPRASRLQRLFTKQSFWEYACATYRIRSTDAQGVLRL
jgi:hypothetical protein